MTPLRLLDLFSGIGGFSLGLERSGAFKTVAFCEIEKFPQQVLRKHWPEVPIYDDIRTLTAERLATDGIAVDAICGGFPCQDISTAGRGAGIEGERSGLWREYARLIGELRPKYVIVENVAALLGRGLDRVLGDLAALGYDAEWHCIPASAVGAPHRRDRLWVVAYTGYGERGASTSIEKRLPNQIIRQPCANAVAGSGEQPSFLADTNSLRATQSQGSQQNERGWLSNSGCEIIVADTYRKRLEGREEAGDACRVRARFQQLFERCIDGYGHTWIVEPDVGRVAHGVPNRMDRLKGLGNAVVPQIPELIGRVILAAEQARASHG